MVTVKEQHCERCASYYMCECDDCKEKEDNEENYPMAGLAYEDPAKWQHLPITDESKSTTQKQCSAMYASGTAQCQRISQTGSKYCANHQNWILKETIERFCDICGTKLPIWRQVNSLFCSKKCATKSSNQNKRRRKNG